MSLRIPLLPRPIRWLPTVFVAGLICYGSILTTAPTTVPIEALSGTVDAGRASAIAPPLEGAIHPSYRRHALAYATLTLSLAYAVADREASIVRKAVFVFAAAMAYGIAMEFGQSFRPERTTSLLDVAANATGAAAALHWYALERRARFVPVREIARAGGSTRGGRS